MDIFLLHQLHQLITGVGGKGNFNVAVLVYKPFQNGRHMGLGKGLAGTDAKHPGNGIRLMGYVIPHVLVLLQFLFRKGEETISCVCEMDPLIGTDK